MTTPRFRRLSWREFDRAVALLADPMPAATCIYGVPRGGMPLAVALSHRTALPLVLRPQPGMVIVDDIADSGATLARLLAQFPDCRAITWVRRMGCKVPTRSFHHAPEGEWIVFPWEDAGRAEADWREYHARTHPPARQ